MSTKSARSNQQHFPLKSVVKLSAVALMALLMPRSLHRDKEFPKPEVKPQNGTGSATPCTDCDEKSS
ncbi:hypothetical protein [Alkanindiges illinoisensis]|uniref:Uncharacterized protein n=1 Tax=Alkanindiges illinoisensis TaxID=197183 RepID=A0A4Y7XER4_9GAMM|nr:hypothetical protein [Alkanindiges illinoisensis]TEU30290.1 hypothetical protein E2B99_02855 [Alkanindiges illinoisensis]